MIKSPVIVLGMHRSGTTLLAKLLQEYGIYMGSVKEQNFESAYFLNINEKIFRFIGAKWYDPTPFEFIGDVDKKNIIKYIKKSLNSPKTKFYFNKEQDNYNFFNIDFIWGWKDPRNTFTLKYWQDVFPDAKVIHIYRHPMDVAMSLSKREIVFSRNGRLKWFYNITKSYLKIGFWVERCPALIDIEKGFSLWEKYTDAALDYSKNGMGVLNVCYESLLLDPTSTLCQIFSFLDLEINQEKINKLLK